DGSVRMFDLRHVALEKEELVAQQPATERSTWILHTVIVLLGTEELGQVRAGEGLLPISPIARVKRATCELVLHESMKLVRTAACGNVDHASGGSAVFGLKAGTLDLHFLHELEGQ